MKIAILGGSFNPVHNAHIMLATEVLKKGYNKVLFVPAFKPPHKELAQGASDAQRLEMLKRAVSINSCFEIETCEMDRQGVSYTIETIFFIEKKYSEKLQGKVGLIIGEDLVDTFNLWKNVDLLVERVDILLAKRTSNVQKINDSDLFSYPCTYLENENLDISSHMIRDLIQQKKEWKHLVPSEVYEYILKEELYAS